MDRSSSPPVQPVTVVQAFPAPAGPLELIAVPAEVLAQVAASVSQARTMEVKDRDSFDRADILNGEIRATRKRLEELRAEAKAPVLQLGKNIDAAAREVRLQLDEAAGVLGGRLLVFQREQERIAAEARRVQEEAERKAREAREEHARKVREAEAAEALAIAKAADDDIFGDTPDPAPVVVPEPMPEPVYVPVVPVLQALKSRSVTTHKVYRLVIEDRDAIPREVAGIQLWTLDERAVKKILRAGGKVPGCILEADETMKGKGR